MSQDYQLIDGINVTSSDVKCPGCGTAIGVKFDPATGTLVCPFCGLNSKLPTPQNAAVTAEFDFNSALQRANVNWGRIKKLVECSNCGGQSLYDAEQITGACPFCGSTSVAPAAENNQIMAPNAVIPFAVTKEMAEQIFMDYIKKCWAVPKKVYNCKLENLTGVYLPFWTFDALTASRYCAFFRKDRDAQLEMLERDWFEYVDDIVVCASAKVKNPYIPKLQNYDITKAVPYSPEYLAGIPAERYTLGLDYCWERSKEQITRKLKKDIHLADRRQDVDWIRTNYYNVKFRCLLAPMYFGSFKYRKNTYHVAINGQTGKTLFTVPRYFAQMIIVAAIASILTLVGYFALVYLFPDSPLMWFYRFIYGG